MRCVRLLKGVEAGVEVAVMLRCVGVRMVEAASRDGSSFV